MNYARAQCLEVEKAMRMLTMTMLTKMLDWDKAQAEPWPEGCAWAHLQEEADEAWDMPLEEAQQAVCLLW